MATKDQERKALEQIRKIVAGLGDDSYIGMAFEGCFEKAEENIDNDFGCSWKQEAESNRIEAEKWMDEAKDAKEAYKSLLNTYNDMKTDLENTQEDCAEWIKRCKERREENQELENTIATQQEELKKQAQMIIELKAKLYDLIMK